MNIDFTNLDKDKILKALKFATERHGDQKRATGAPYITHPVEVATKVSEKLNDTAAVCAALLHDLVEDTPTSLSEIEDKFGKEVAFLVNGLSMDSNEDSEVKKSNYHKKLREFGLKDSRIFDIKFQDVLHNITTIEQKGKESALNYMKRVESFFIPLAEELKQDDILNKLKSEVEKLKKRIK